MGLAISAHTGDCRERLAFPLDGSTAFSTVQPIRARVGHDPKIGQPDPARHQTLVAGPSRPGDVAVAQVPSYGSPTDFGIETYP
jgi:hypothetical protein